VRLVDCHSGEQAVGASGKLFQLGLGPVDAARLEQNAPVQIGYLVAADN
jgi:hypothetical protein